MQKRWLGAVLDGDNWLTDVSEAAQEELRSKVRSLMLFETVSNAIDY